MKKCLPITVALLLVLPSITVARESLTQFAEHLVTQALKKSVEKATERPGSKATGAYSPSGGTKNQGPSVENHANPSFCKDNYFNGTAPNILNAKLDQKTQHICYPGYATYFSGVTRTPLWSADHLTLDRISNACAMKRQDAFHPDENLAPDERAELSDYVRSGYDRGHMVPSADATDPSSQADTFSLANMVPQIHANNAGIWERLENGARNAARSGHDIYVVSGPLFEGASIEQLQHRVMIPTSVFKAVYDATSHQAGVFVTTNNDDQNVQLLSVNDLASRSGIDVFPTLPTTEKTQASPVISPEQRTQCKGIKKHD